MTCPRSTSLLHRNIVVLGLALLGLVAAPRAAFAVGEQNGRIRGIITEANTKAPLGGAEITVSSPALIGGPRSLSANDDGSYEVANLPPGIYDVLVSFGGANPVRRRIRVRQDEVAPLDIAWSAELKQVQTYNIVEETHLTRPDSTQTGTVLGADTEARIALPNRNYQTVLTQVAGVSDPAGRGIPNIKGANRLSNRYLVDGMDITDSVTNNFSTQVNLDSIGSFQIITGGMEAEYNALGGVINLNTFTGGDKLRVDTSFYFSSDKLALSAQTGNQLWEHERPYSIDPAPSTQTYQANFSISGPIIKRRLWVSASFEYDYKQQQIPIGTPFSIQHPTRREHDFFPRLKITWAPSQKDRVTLTGNGDPALVYNRDQTNGTLPNSEYGQSQGGAFAVLQWDHFHSEKLSTNLQTGFNYNTVSQYPMGQFGGIDPLPASALMDPRFGDKSRVYDPNLPRHFSLFDNSSWYNALPINLDRRYTVQFDPSLSLRGKAVGTHDAKFGIQSRFVYHTFSQHTPGGTSYTDNGGPHGESDLCDPVTGMNCAGSTRVNSPDFRNNQYGFGIGFYAQDRWRPIKRLTILPGLRVDYGLTRNSLGQTVSSMVGVGPRIGATYDLTGDQKTIFSAYYGRSNDTLYLLPASRADISAVQTKQHFDPATSTWVTDSVSGGSGGYQLDRKATPPHTDEVSLQLVREFFRNSIAGVNYTYRRISNIWDAVEVNRIWDASGSRVVNYVDQRPETIYKYTTPDGNYRIYQGIDFTVESRPTPHLDFYAAYTLSWLYGPGSDEVFTVGTGGSAYANPRQYKFYQGFLPEDQRHQLRVHGSYEWHGLIVGVNFNYASGAPLTKLYYNFSDNSPINKRTPQGTDPGATINDPRATAAFRLPDTFLLNLRVAYDLHELTKQHIMVMADIFNAFNNDAPSLIEARDGTLFGTSRGQRTQPFRVQFGLRYTY